MEQDFILELFHKGTIYPLPAHIQLSSDGILFSFSLPNVDVIFKKNEDGSYEPLYQSPKNQKKVDRIDRQLVEVLSSHIEAIL